ncbi:DNA recombination protein RmuC [Kineococcus glutinatus]|uniref:Lsr2 DNA-binding domain-containing protein n=1 Tax=Kineococcus glutinatus TaxID=1070872 RepID=A0ABP9H5Z0_9ACTN
MLFLLIAVLVVSSIAAVLSLLAWRTRTAPTTSAPAGTDPELTQGVQTVRMLVESISSSLRDEHDRLRQAQGAATSEVRAELRSAAEDEDRALRELRQELVTTLYEQQRATEQTSREASTALRTTQSAELAALRGEVQQQLASFQELLTVVTRELRAAVVDEVKAVVERQEAARLEQAAQLDTFSAAQRAAFADLQTATTDRVAELTASTAAARTEQGEQLAQFRTELSDSLHRFQGELATVGKELRQEQTGALQRMQQEQAEKLTALTATVSGEQREARQELQAALDKLSAANEVKLEQMRATVQEKLDATLGERLDASFKQVSGQLESVHKGLGEMQVLAQGVGSLQRTLTNVKTRGVWAELQLDALLADLLTPEQYEKQYRVNPESVEMADFAVRLPGGEDGRPVWLAIDSKFPMDVYERLQASWEEGDTAGTKAATKAFLDRVRAEATSIAGKYVNPPHTTDFAVMYLPTEGLFAEVVRQHGLVHELRTKHRIVVAGPTTLTALLGSLSMGFRTLAIQRRSSEVWQVLGHVKTEFENSAGVWEKLVKHLDTARNTAEQAGVRHRAIGRRLRNVESLPLEAPHDQALAGAVEAIAAEVDDVFAGGEEWLAPVPPAAAGSSRSSSTRIREWARAAGYSVAGSGRLPHEVVAAYEEAHGQG